MINAPVSIPGISLPTETISDGEQAEAKLPPLTVNVDGSPVGRGGSQRSLITISTLGLTMNFELGGEGIDLIFDDGSLVGKQTTINLGESKIHELVIRCSYLGTLNPSSFTGCFRIVSAGIPPGVE